MAQEGGVALVPLAGHASDRRRTRSCGVVGQGTIEDNGFIGARSEVAEGVIVREGSVLSMGVFIGASTRIIDRESGEIFQGEVPAYSVVVPGSLPDKPRKSGANAAPRPNL